MIVRAALVRLAVALRLRAAPAEAVPTPRIHRGERELSAGPAFLGTPVTPLAKLPPAEAERLLGIPVRIVGR